MKPFIDHVQVTVKDMARAIPFYNGMLALLGFDISLRTEATVAKHELHVVEYPHPTLAIAINSPRAPLAHETVHRRRPGALHHLAFRADSRAEVDWVHAGLVGMGAKIVGGPKLWPEHGADYYAVFFKDPDGIKYEVVCSGEPHC